MKVGLRSIVFISGLLIVLLASTTLIIQALRPGDPPREPSQQLNNMRFSSPDFNNDSQLPLDFTCHVESPKQPRFTLSNPPAFAQSYAIAIRQTRPNNNPHTHWLAWNIPVESKQIDLTNLDEAVTVGTNDHSQSSYHPPCSDNGQPITYTMTLYALDNKLDLPTEATYSDLLLSMQRHIISTRELKASVVNRAPTNTQD